MATFKEEGHIVKIVIFTGGTGSIALQRGLHHALGADLDGVETKVIVNAYDNGLSTGAVRRVMSGQILGPSDVRKNQATRLQLDQPASPWLEFLGCRFSTEARSAHSFCVSKVMQLVSALEECGRSPNCRDILLGALDRYFRAPTAGSIEYHDFSLANIVYAGLAAANGNSLRAAATIMAEAMKIADSVLLNDDESLFLGAITSSGRRITDEGEIVCWGSESDPFVNVFFWNANGDPVKPHLCLEAWHAILEADLIVLSSGTQWSSLIPTYVSEGFRSAINSSKATILMVMNRTPDRDSPGQMASDIVAMLVPHYFEAGRLHVVADTRGHAGMRSLNPAALAKVASFTPVQLSGTADPPDKHDPQLLATAVGQVFFRGHLDSASYVFDYDDTLVGRNGKYPRSSQFNVRGIARLNRLTRVGICTGNTIRAVDLKDEGKPGMPQHDVPVEPIRVFADGGVNEYAVDLYATAGKETPAYLLRCIWPAALLPRGGINEPARIVDALCRSGIPRENVEIRGEAVIAIRPVEKAYRRTVASLVRHVIAGSDLIMRERGTTTIEICNPVLSKSHALTQLCMTSSPARPITYVGDELESGNDQDVAKLAAVEGRVRCLHVESPAKTAFFISTLIEHLERHDQR